MLLFYLLVPSETIIMGGDPDLYYSLEGVKAACDRIRGRIPEHKEFSEPVWTEFFFKVKNNTEWKRVLKNDHLEFFVWHNFYADGRLFDTVKACNRCDAKIPISLNPLFYEPKIWSEPTGKPFGPIEEAWKQQNMMYPAVCVQGKCRR